MTTDKHIQFDMFGEPQEVGVPVPKKGSVNNLRRTQGQVEAPEPEVEVGNRTTYYANGPIIGDFGFQEDQPYTPVVVEGRPYRLQIFDMNLMQWVVCPPEQYEDMFRRVRRYIHGDRSIERRMHLTNERHQQHVYLEDDVYDGPLFWDDEEDEDV